jgi:hypothetical protein
MTSWRSMPCECMYLRCLFVSQAWRRRSRIRNETHTPCGTSTPQKEPCHSTIHTRSGGNSSARVKCFSTIPTPKSGSTRRRVPRRATIRIRSSGSLSDPTRPTKALATRKLLSAINTNLRIWRGIRSRRVLRARPSSRCARCLAGRRLP